MSSISELLKGCSNVTPPINRLNSEIFSIVDFSSLNSHFWGNIMKMIIVVNSRIFPEFTLHMIKKFSTNIAILKVIVRKTIMEIICRVNSRIFHKTPLIIIIVIFTLNFAILAESGNFENFLESSLVIITL